MIWQETKERKPHVWNENITEFSMIKIISGMQLHCKVTIHNNYKSYISKGRRKDFEHFH